MANNLDSNPPRGLAIASLVLGILSLVLLWPLGIGAIILALFAPTTNTWHMQTPALVGLVCGILGVVLGIVMWVATYFLVDISFMQGL